VRVFFAIGWLALLTAVGTVGFRLLEELSWIEAFYFTVVTISTVGFGDVVPVTLGGRLFASLLIISGVGTAVYVFSVVAQDVLEGNLRDFYLRSSMMRKIDGISSHVIACGYGRFGRVVVEELQGSGRDVVVVESDVTLETSLNEAGLDFVIGSATKDEVLTKAGIQRAESLVIATSEAANSVFITLVARELNPELSIHARGETESAIRRLRRAGADFVSSPYQMGGMRMAASILRPSVVDFLELSLPGRSEEIDLEEVRAGEGSPILGRPVREIEHENSRLRIVALKKRDTAIELVPDPALEVEPGDLLVVIGERSQLSQLAVSPDN